MGVTEDCVHVCMCVCVCASTLSCFQLFVTRGLQHTRLLCLWNFPDKNTGAGCLFLLQENFLTQESKLCLLHLLQCRHILYRCVTWEDPIEDSGEKIVDCTKLFILIFTMAMYGDSIVQYQGWHPSLYSYFFSFCTYILCTYMYICKYIQMYIFAWLTCVVDINFLLSFREQ